MTNWPAHERPTEARRATLDRAIRGLEDEPPREGAVVSPRGRGQNQERALEGPPTVRGTSPRARWVRRCSHARSRPCTRPTGLHRGGRPMRSKPLRSGQLPVVMRRCLLGGGRRVAEQAPPKRAATRGLKGAPPREEGVASPRESGATIECSRGSPTAHGRGHVVCKATAS
jgi:hypothetical protein